MITLRRLNWLLLIAGVLASLASSIAIQQQADREVLKALVWVSGLLCSATLILFGVRQGLALGWAFILLGLITLGFVLY